MSPDLFFPCVAKSLMPGVLFPPSLSGAGFSECLHTVFRLHGFGFLTEEQDTIGVVNVCLPLVAILLFPVPLKTSPAQSKRFQEAVSSAAFCEVFHGGECARRYIWDECSSKNW